MDLVGSKTFTYLTHTSHNFSMVGRAYFRKARNACGMNKKGYTLVNLGQFKVDACTSPPPHTHTHTTTTTTTTTTHRHIHLNIMQTALHADNAYNNYLKYALQCCCTEKKFGDSILSWGSYQLSSIAATFY